MSELSPEKLLSKESKRRFIENVKEVVGGVDNDVPKLRASVLIPICIMDDEVCVIFTLRSSKLKRNAGEMSLPGGKDDPGETRIETALRETNEELGIPINEIEVWTEFPNIIGLSNELCLVPVVGFIPNFDVKKLKPNPEEVEKVFVIPIRSLVDKRNHGFVMYNNVPSYTFSCPEAEYNHIWGITGLVVVMFLLCLVPNHVYDGSLSDCTEYSYEKVANKSKL